MPVARQVATWAHEPSAKRPAFVLAGHTLTYQELAIRSAAVASGLSDVPRRPREWLPGTARLLAIGIGNHPSFAELFVGSTAGHGACAVLDPSWGIEQARAVLRRLRPDLLVVCDDQPDLRQLAADLDILTLVAGQPDSPGSWQQWMDEHRGADPAEFLTSGTGTTPFLVGFTSGTTGLPKAFWRTRESWRISLARGRPVWGMDASNHTLAPGPLVHGLSLYALAECLDAGATFHGLSRFDRLAMVRRLSSADISRLVVAPTMLAALCAAVAETRQTFPGVCAVISGGAKLDVEFVRAIHEVLPNARVSEYYGASELGFVTVRFSGAEAIAPGDVGTPFPGVTIEVRDTAGRVLPDGQVGVVHVRSPLCCGGYLWGDGGFRSAGEWATVGDIGWRSADGHLHLVGRGGMVVTGGLNVYPAEVEQVLTALPQIDKAVVTSVPDGYLGHALVAVISGPATAELTHTRLFELCRPTLAKYKVPRRFYTISEWPLTASGKIARGRIDEWIADDDTRLTPLRAGREDATAGDR
jgi:acyl-CoA synthetase (AMP-forming)/AMP-acid ligase II